MWSLRRLFSFHYFKSDTNLKNVIFDFITMNELGKDYSVNHEK